MSGLKKGLLLRSRLGRGCLRRQAKARPYNLVTVFYAVRSISSRRLPKGSKTWTRRKSLKEVSGLWEMPARAEAGRIAARDSAANAGGAALAGREYGSKARDNVMEPGPT